MDVEDAFTEDAISALGTDVAEETDADLKDVITRICVSNEIAPMIDDHMNVSKLCFVAGRTYQSDLNPDVDPVALIVERYPQLATEFIHFLVGRGAP
jgi:hypothetical protein